MGEYTAAPEILGGRVKTLHPRVHGGILYRRGLASDEADVKARDIPPIDLVVVNLYPFREAVAAGKPFPEVVEDIDIGGPAMVRSSAKNAAHVGVVVDPADYEQVASEIEAQGALSERHPLRAHEEGLRPHGGLRRGHHRVPLLPRHARRGGGALPGHARRDLEQGAGPPLRREPPPGGAFYRAPRAPEEPTVAFAKVLQGKELSYNNLLDLEAALAAVKEYEATACVVIKHNTPSGVAVAGSAGRGLRAGARLRPGLGLRRHRGAEPPGGRGRGEGARRPLPRVRHRPGLRAGGPGVLAAKKNLRLLESPRLGDARASWKRRPEEARELRSITGGLLVMDRDLGSVRREDCKVMTKRAPTEKEWQDLLFAWKVVKHVKSNAIVFAAGDRTLAIGGGQTSRVESVKIARMKARFPLAGSAVGSDAFFPFPDGVEEIIAGGATAIIQPGGSVRDAEVVAVADAAGIAMVATGMRHFRH